MADHRRFLLERHGLYCRAAGKGCTKFKDDAGRYFEHDAEPEKGVFAIHEDAAPDYSHACSLLDQVEHLTGRVDRLRKCLAEIDDMITNCAGVPQEPDSLPMMVRKHVRAALAGGYPKIEKMGA